MTDIEVSTLLALPLEEIVQRLPAFLGSYIVAEARDAVVSAVEAVREEAEPADWARLLGHMQTLGDNFGGHVRDDLATRIAVAYMEPLVDPASPLDGLQHLDAALALQRSGRRVMIVGNHLSYADTMALGQLLVLAGRSDVRSLLTAVAGPKVYSEPMRRLAAAGIHSIKVAQSSKVATGQPALSPREIVRIAKRCLQVATEMMDAGRIVLIYPAGTRSRTGRLQPFIRATNRWLTLPEVVLLPYVGWGNEALYSPDDDLMRPATCHGRFGPIIDPGALLEAGSNRDGILETAHRALEELLPPDYRALPGAPRIS